MFAEHQQMDVMVLEHVSVRKPEFGILFCLPMSWGSIGYPLSVILW